MTYCSINGEITAAANAVISIQDRGFRYGDGVFETIAVEGFVPYQFEWHVRRLAGGLGALKIVFDTGVLQRQCQELLRKNTISDGLLRIQVTRGSGSKGYLPEAARASYVIETLPAPAYDLQQVRLWTSSYRKMSPRALPVQYKLCQGLNSTLARMEAVENGCFDALMLTENGVISETSSGNIFWLKDGVLCTPSLATGCLEGSTRAAIIRLSPYPVQEMDAPLAQLETADAVIICNVVWKALAVLPYRSAALAAELSALIGADRKAYAKMHQKEWLE